MCVWPLAGFSVHRPASRVALTALVSALPSQLPKVLELVGLGYSTWFVYRYLLFKARVRAHPIARAGPFEEANALPLQESRKELAADVEELKKRISGEQ